MAIGVVRIRRDGRRHFYNDFGVVLIAWHLEKNNWEFFLFRGPNDKIQDTRRPSANISYVKDCIRDIENLTFTFFFFNFILFLYTNSYFLNYISLFLYFFTSIFLYFLTSILLKGSVHTWNKVGQIYLGFKKKHILLIHFGQMSINYWDISEFDLTQILKMWTFDQNVIIIIVTFHVPNISDWLYFRCELTL